MICVLHARDGSTVTGRNDCARPQLTCPRVGLEGYDKCVSICGQDGHAEQQALRKAKALGIDLQGAHAYLAGHYYACQDCCAELRDAGVDAITILTAVELHVVSDAIERVAPETN